MIFYRIFRIYFSKNILFHEYIILWFLAVTILFCSLSNSNLLPEYLGGTGIHEFRSSYTGLFYIISIFSVLTLQKVVLLFSPLFIIGQYFYYKQYTVFETTIYNSVPPEIQA